MLNYSRKHLFYYINLSLFFALSGQQFQNYFKHPTIACDAALFLVFSGFPTYNGLDFSVDIHIYGTFMNPSFVSDYIHYQSAYILCEKKTKLLSMFIKNTNINYLSLTI